MSAEIWPLNGLQPAATTATAHDSWDEHAGIFSPEPTRSGEASCRCGQLTPRISINLQAAVKTRISRDGLDWTSPLSHCKVSQ